jgi:hypothetical protein
VQVRAPADGAELFRLPARGEVAQRTAASVPLLLTDGRLHALDPVTGDSLWTAPAVGLPTAALDGDKEAGSATSLLVPDAEGFVRRDPATGSELSRSEAAGVPEGGVTSALGPVVVYRLDDRVLAYG